MSGRTLERQESIETLTEEQKTLREIQLVREQQERERVQDRVLYFEESGGIKIVSYSEDMKETMSRDLEGREQVVLEEISIDEKNELDSIRDYIAENDQEEIEQTETDIDEIEEEIDLDDDFARDEIDFDDDMEYDD